MIISAAKPGLDGGPTESGNFNASGVDVYGFSTLIISFCHQLGLIVREKLQLQMLQSRRQRRLGTWSCT